ncbi:hypothetical protein HaLaN_03114, partial [Haematococcus lacustris]
ACHNVHTPWLGTVYEQQVSKGKHLVGLQAPIAGVVAEHPSRATATLASWPQQSPILAPHGRARSVHSIARPGLLSISYTPMATKQSPMATPHAQWGCHAQQCVSARPSASLPPGAPPRPALRRPEGCPTAAPHAVQAQRPAAWCGPAQCGPLPGLFGRPPGQPLCQ